MTREASTVGDLGTANSEEHTRPSRRRFYGKKIAFVFHSATELSRRNDSTRLRCMLEVQGNDVTLAGKSDGESPKSGPKDKERQSRASTPSTTSRNAGS